MMIKINTTIRIAGLNIGNLHTMLSYSPLILPYFVLKMPDNIHLNFIGLVPKILIHHNNILLLVSQPNTIIITFIPHYIYLISQGWYL